MTSKFNFYSFWKSILYVFQGQVFAQLIPLISYVVIARLIDAKFFGLFAIWFGVAKILSIMSTLRLETSLVNEPDGNKRDEAVFNVIVTSSLTSLLFIVVTMIFYKLNIVDFLANLSLLAWALLVPFAFMLACDITLQTWAAADGRYKDLNKIRLIQSSSIAIFQVTLVYLYRDTNALIIGASLGCLFGICLSQFLHPLGIYFNKNFPLKLKDFWLKHQRFPIYSLPADTVSSFIAQLPVLIVGSRFGLEIAGQLALTLRMMAAPVALLGRAVQDVFKRQAALDFINLGNCKKLYEKTFYILLPGGLIFIALTVSIGEQMFILFFGDQWQKAGQFAVWLSPNFALGFIASPLSYIVYIVNRQNVDLFWQLTLMIVVFVTLLLPSEIFITLVAYSIGYSFMYIIYIAITYRLSLGNIKNKLDN